MKEKKITATDLKKIKPFNNLHKKTLAELVRLGTIHVYQPHAKIYEAGTINNKLILILRGSISIAYQMDDHKVPIEIFNEGELWGYTTLMHQGKKYPYYIYNGARVTEVIELPVAKVLAAIEQQGSGRGVLMYELSKLQSERSRLRQEKFMLLFGLNAFLQGEIKSDLLLENMLKLTANALTAKRVLVATFDDIRKQIVIEAAINYNKKISKARYAITTDTLLSVVYNTGDALHITRKTFERKFGSAPYSRPSMMIAPIFVDNVVYGAILCADKHDNMEFNPEDVLTLQATSSLFAQGLLHVHHEEDILNGELVSNHYIEPH